MKALWKTLLRRGPTRPPPLAGRGPAGAARWGKGPRPRDDRHHPLPRLRAGRVPKPSHRLRRAKLQRAGVGAHGHRQDAGGRLFDRRDGPPRPARSSTPRPSRRSATKSSRSSSACWAKSTSGILTGDVVINPDAPVLIMTTEIFRNLLHQDPERVDGRGLLHLRRNPLHRRSAPGQRVGGKPHLHAAGHAVFGAVGHHSQRGRAGGMDDAGARPSRWRWCTTPSGRCR